MAVDYEISGPAGNVYAVLGSLTSYLRQLGRREDHIEAILKEARNGDYENALEVFHREIGCEVNLTMNGDDIFVDDLLMPEILYQLHD